MTDDTNKPYTYSQEELDTAAAEENMAMGQSPMVLAAQNRHLSDRVVLLRAEVDRLTRLINGVPPRSPQDRRPKKKAAKKS